MAKLFNRVRMSTSTTGTGTITLGSATSNAFLTFAEAGVANNDIVSYVIEDGTDFEAGIGTYTSSGTTLSRDTVTVSKIGGTAGTSKITLSGSAIVFIDALAEDVLSRKVDTTATNSVQNVSSLRHQTSGTPATGIGVGLPFEVETASGNFETGAIIEAETTDVTDTSEDFDLVFKLMAAGAAAAEKLRIRSAPSGGAALRVADNMLFQIDGTTYGRVDNGGVQSTADFHLNNNSGSFKIGTDADIVFARLAAGNTRLEGITAATNSVQNLLRLRHSTTGSAAAGIGVGLQFEQDTGSDNYEIGATIEAVTTDVTSTSEDFDVVVKTMAAGAAAAERLRLSLNGVTPSTRIIDKVTSLTDGANVTLNSQLGNVFKLVAAGNRTIDAPTNKPASGEAQRIVIMHEASGADRTLSLATGASGAFRFGTDVTALTATTSGLVDYIGCVFNQADDRWDVVSYSKGY